MSFTASRTLIVFALESETQGHWHGRDILHTGIGKVNAAYQMAKALAEWRQTHGSPPDLVLNLGSAGSSHFNAGIVVNCTGFIQRDFDVTPLGFQPYQTPFEDTPVLLETGLRFPDYPQGICGTGDSFVTDRAMHAWNVVDMEAYALAKICAAENIPFGCLKFITDGADGHAATTWEAALEEAALQLRAACDAIFAD